jgi:hypothetical protein
MNGNQMKTSVNTSELSLHLAQGAGRRVKIRAERGGGTEEQGFGMPKWLTNPCVGKIIVKTTSKTQSKDMNTRPNGKSREICPAPESL